MSSTPHFGIPPAPLPPPPPAPAPGVPEVRFLGEMQRLRMEEGDFVVIHCDHDLNPDDYRQVQQSVAAALNLSPRTVVVVGAGMKLGLLNMGAPK